MPKQNKKPQPRQKALYRVKNWSEYDKALVQRGSITFWMSDDFEKTWLHSGEKQRGSQFDYSDQAILVMLTVKEVFHLTNRGVEGFVRSLFWMMKINLPVPDHSTLSNRGKALKVELPKKTSQSLNIVMDSTGLKIYGEGEWKVRMHGVSKRRTWRKLHLGTNPEDGEIQAVILTENNVSDDAAVAVLLEQIEQEIIKFGADGAYDKRKVYDCLNAHSPNVKILIPPRRNARIWKHGNTQAARLKRDENLRSIRKHGRKEWKKNSGYHTRSLVETTMFRLKTIFGDDLSARLLETQTTQALVRCAALNQMTHLGMPQSYKVA
jgi:Transposase DDE domain